MTQPEASRETTIERESRHHFQTYARQPLVLERGEGTRVWDRDGREFIDALGGIAVNVLGHAHPAVVAAIRDQAGHLIHVSNLYYTSPQSALAERLTGLAQFERVFFTNSGAEAVEGAFKLARRQAAKSGRGADIIGVQGCFHGRTLATLSLGAAKYQRGFGPLPPGFATIPRDDSAALDRAITEDTAAFIVEPIQGEGGIREMDPAFLERARRLCHERGVLLLFDEIQCGMGRTGHLFAWQQLGVRPDILITAKGLGGGVPIGAILADSAVTRVLQPGDHGTTFGGNPLACAAALATLDTLDSQDLPARAARLGERARRRLEDIAGASPCVREVRGRGLMIGIELTDDVDGQAMVSHMREHGVLANCTAGSVIRLLPPLTISEADLDRVIEVFGLCLGEVASNG
jgi:predicted acetylornithine/succinylornithine family transaminase